MIVAAHQTMLAPQGAPLPYDAEVEYLESTGTQYVDTGWSLVEPFSVSVSFSISRSITSNNAIFGAYKDDASYPKFQAVIMSTGKTSQPNQTSWASWSGMNMAVSVGNVYAITGTTKSNASDYPIFIFGRNSDRGETLLSNGLRIHSASFLTSSGGGRDYIPVRVGTGSSAVGYLFDRVSGQLFGNAGTGAFAIGPDKA